SIGDVALGYRGTVHFTSTDSKAGLPSNYTFTSTDSGIHSTFSVIYKTASTQSLTGTWSITVKDTNSAATGSDSGTGVTVTPAAAVKLVLAATPPTTIQAGSSAAFNVM